MPIRVCPAGHVTGYKRCPHCAPVLVSPLRKLVRGFMQMAQAAVNLGPSTERVVIKGMKHGSTAEDDIPFFPLYALDANPGKVKRARKHRLHQFLARNDQKAAAAHA